MISIALILACHREAAPPPDLATTLPIEAGVDAGVPVDPFGGNPPPERVDASPRIAKKCTDAKGEGWGGSGGGCGSGVKYRCGAMSYEVRCSSTKRGAVCECIENGRVTGNVDQPKERCGSASNAAEVCGFPPPW